MIHDDAGARSLDETQETTRTTILRRPRYLPGLRHPTGDITSLGVVLRGGTAHWELSEADTALAILAVTAQVDGSTQYEVTPPQLHACGRARWLVELAHTFIIADRARRDDALIRYSGASGAGT